MLQSSSNDFFFLDIKPTFFEPFNQENAEVLTSTNTKYDHERAGRWKLMGFSFCFCCWGKSRDGYRQPCLGSCWMMRCMWNASKKLKGCLVSLSSSSTDIITLSAFFFMSQLNEWRKLWERTTGCNKLWELMPLDYSFLYLFYFRSPFHSPACNKLSILLSSVLNCSIIMKTLKIVFFFFLNFNHGLKPWHQIRGYLRISWLLFFKVSFI